MLCCVAFSVDDCNIGSSFPQLLTSRRSISRRATSALSMCFSRSISGSTHTDVQRPRRIGSGRPFDATLSYTSVRRIASNSPDRICLSVLYTSGCDRPGMSWSRSPPGQALSRLLDGFSWPDAMLTCSSGKNNCPMAFTGSCSPFSGQGTKVFKKLCPALGPQKNGSPSWPAPKTLC